MLAAITRSFTGWLLAFVNALTALLALTTWLAARLAKKLSGSSGSHRRFVELGYQYAPVAMVSLLIGLGGELFESLRLIGLDSRGIGYIKGMLFLMGFLWSLHLGKHILLRQGVPGRWLWLPLLPGGLGSVMVGLFWWPAIIGI